MPPKKKDDTPAKVYLGRPGNNVKIGIVGLPNVGKSTFFNCLSKLNIPAENFPFCTIEPNTAMVCLVFHLMYHIYTNICIGTCSRSKIQLVV